MKIDYILLQKMQPMDSSFWQYKDYEDICGVSLKKRCQIRVEGLKTAILVLLVAISSEVGT